MKNFNINFLVPEGWQELSDKQLRFVFQGIADQNSADELKTLCLIQWGGAKVANYIDNGTYVLRKGSFLFEVTAVSIGELIPHLDWLASVPKTPVRLSKINRREAIPADFQGVPFEIYIICDNLYQGYLQTLDDQLLDQLAMYLYSGNEDKPLKLKKYEQIAVFYWMASLKDFLARRFPNFLQPVNSQNANLLENMPNYGQLLQASMDSQIRALTKGDVTKEAEILASDTWRALTELDAQALEYNQLQQQSQS